MLGSFLKSQGGTVIPLSEAGVEKWVKAMQPLVLNFKNDLMSKGFAEEEVDSDLSFVNECIEY